MSFGGGTSARTPGSASVHFQRLPTRWSSTRPDSACEGPRRGGSITISNCGCRQSRALRDALAIQPPVHSILRRVSKARNKRACPSKPKSQRPKAKENFKNEPVPLPPEGVGESNEPVPPPSGFSRHWRFLALEPWRSLRRSGISVAHLGSWPVPELSEKRSTRACPQSTVHQPTLEHSSGSVGPHWQLPVGDRLLRFP